ncbi:hypothetical protein C8Q76DRAFT_826406 [Earliella scabrosa]|nr:hypothetical protein C8Q76DRAFT_826406 [Earliella scabrosa]
MITLSSRVPQDEVYIPSSTREIGTLTLAASSTADLAIFPLCHLLRLFTSITKLSVSNNRCTWDPSIADSSFVVALRSAPRIAGLLLNAEWVEETCNGYLGVLHLYHHSSPRWTLRDLWIGLPRMCSTDDSNDIIHHCQESLEELVVSPCATTWTLLSPSQTVASLPIERWRWPDLCKCRSLRSLVFQFPTLSWSKKIRDELPSDPLIPVYDYTLAAIVEMVLSAPTEVATIGISFLHGSDYDDEVAPSHSWPAGVVSTMRCAGLPARMCTAASQRTTCP